MKIQAVHYEVIRAAIEKQNSMGMKAEYKANGMSKKRYGWDALREALAADYFPFICDGLYTYLNDSHIDTAILKAVGEY